MISCAIKVKINDQYYTLDEIYEKDDNIYMKLSGYDKNVNAQFKTIVEIEKLDLDFSNGKNVINATIRSHTNNLRVRS